MTDFNRNEAKKKCSSLDCPNLETYRLMHEKRDKSILRIFINEKFRKLFNFFPCILLNYLTHESQKDFWKNSHFENTRAGFLLWCQNSLWQNTSKMMHFQAWKNKYFMPYYIVPFDPIKIFTHQAPQKDLLNLSFVKDIYVLAKKLP